MSPGELQEPNGHEGSLTARLDPSIGEASTGIGLLMSELVRRSLRAGVADIDQTLKSFATQQVAVAVEGKMAEVTEVAESTSRRVSESLVREVATESRQSTERLSHSLTDAVGRLEGELGDARRRSDETVRTLEEVTEKARQSWKRIKSDVEALQASAAGLQAKDESLQGSLDSLQQELHQARRQEESLRAELLSLANRTSSLEQSLVEMQQLQQRLSDSLNAALDREQSLQTQLARLEAEQAAEHERHSVLSAQIRAHADRLADIERPKGWSALFQRWRGKGKSDVAESPPPGLPGAAAPVEPLNIEAMSVDEEASGERRSEREPPSADETR
ncbi:MAG: hypothetical protein AB7F89_21975 [Pirellulaceae bacterium]